MNWREENNYFTKEFIFKDFKEAFSFMTQAAKLAEEMNHHPLWTNEYNKVTIQLTTHDTGNTITKKDKDLAEAIDKLIKV